MRVNRNDLIRISRVVLGKCPICSSTEIEKDYEPTCKGCGALWSMRAKKIVREDGIQNIQVDIDIILTGKFNEANNVEDTVPGR